MKVIAGEYINVGNAVCIDPQTDPQLGTVLRKVRS